MSIEARSGIVAAGGDVWLLVCCLSLAASAASDSFVDFSNSFADFNETFSVDTSACCAVNVWTVIAVFCATNVWT